MSPPSTSAGNCNGRVVHEAITVDSHLPKKVKKAIIEGDFVEFKDLLQKQSKKKSKAKDNTTVLTFSEGRVEAEVEHPASQDSLEFDDWISAWNIFQAVTTFASTDPKLGFRMAKHFQVVHTLWKDGYDWSGYDRQFRTILAEVDDDSLKWGDVHEDARGSARLKKAESSGSFKAAFRPTTTKEIPYGFCHEFHRGNNHPRAHCNYWHKCYNGGCFKDHPFSKCPFERNEPFIKITHLPNQRPIENKAFLNKRARASHPYQRGQKTFGRGSRNEFIRH